jgi:hypothetical protein
MEAHKFVFTFRVCGVAQPPIFDGDEDGVFRLLFPALH